jgi:hypothetical protein
LSSKREAAGIPAASSFFEAGQRADGAMSLAWMGAKRVRDSVASSSASARGDMAVMQANSTMAFVMG